MDGRTCLLVKLNITQNKINLLYLAASMHTMIAQFFGLYSTLRLAKLVSFPIQCACLTSEINYNKINILLTSFPWSILSVTDSCFSPLIYGPCAWHLGHKSTKKTESVTYSTDLKNTVSKRYIFTVE